MRYQKWGKNWKTKNVWFEFFFGKHFVGNDGFQIMFVYQPKPKTLELKKERTEYVIGW